MDEAGVEEAVVADDDDATEDDEGAESVESAEGSEEMAGRCSVSTCVLVAAASSSLGRTGGGTCGVLEATAGGGTLKMPAGGCGC